MGAADAAAKDGKILRVDVNETAVDCAVAGDDTIAKDFLVGEAKVLGIMGDKDIQFAETALVKKERQAFTAPSYGRARAGERSCLRRHPGRPASSSHATR